MNDFESIVSKYRGKIGNDEIKEALRILLEKKNEIRMTKYSTLLGYFLVIAGFLIGFISGLKSNDPNSLLSLIATLVLAVVVGFSIMRTTRKYGQINVDVYEEYLEAIIKLEEKKS
jgi:uncharacterized membrane-anchored protein YitT (DUF2179 family)